MNDFEIKRAARIERMRRRADRIAHVAAARLTRGEAMFGQIPFGQPIQPPGHHSHNRDVRFRARAGEHLTKGYALQKEAADLERRASKAETSTAVSSDDPEAVTKLLEQIEEEKVGQARVLLANKALKAGKPDAEVLAILHWAPDKQRTLDIWRSMGRKTLPTTNGSANIRRLEARVKLLREKASSPVAPAETHGDVTIDEEANRVRLRFLGKPAADVIRALKSAGFRWTPSEGVWQRMASNQAWYHARQIAGRTVALAPGLQTLRHDVIALEAGRTRSGQRLPDE